MYHDFSLLPVARCLSAVSPDTKIGAAVEVLSAAAPFGGLYGGAGQPDLSPTRRDGGRTTPTNVMTTSTARGYAQGAMRPPKFGAVCLRLFVNMRFLLLKS